MKNKERLCNSYDEEYESSLDVAKSIIGHRSADGYISNIMCLNIAALGLFFMISRHAPGTWRTVMTVLLFIAVPIISYYVAKSYYTKMLQTMYVFGHVLKKERTEADMRYDDIKRELEQTRELNYDLQNKISELEKARS